MTCASEMHSGSFYFLIKSISFCFLLLAISQKKSKCFNSPLDTISSVIGAYVELSRALTQLKLLNIAGVNTLF